MTQVEAMAQVGFSWEVENRKRVLTAEMEAAMKEREALDVFIAFLEDRISHRYLSTACTHDHHGECRQSCKFCEAPCRCACHDAERWAIGAKVKR